MSENNSAPDSWDAEDTEESLANNLARSLNVNAPVFIPNVNAPEFVPNFLKQPVSEPVAPDPPPEKGSNEEMKTDSPAHKTWSEASNSNSTSSLSEAASSGGTPAVTTPSEPQSTGCIPTMGTGAEDTSPTSDGHVPADSWEEAADAFTPSPTRESASTPEDEEDTSESDSIERKKKKAPVVNNVSTVTKEPINVIFIGHVDAGKSTIGGQIMYLTGMVDRRTLDKYEREAREKNRETWYLSWALDTNLEERDKGKTVEVGRAYFETEQKHFTILDAPGHKSFVPNMIGGACQADLAVLVISARKGEFETGFDRGGQTREHAMLAKTAGVRHLIVLINKMDDSTVNWQEARYNECRDKLIPYLKKVGFNPNKDVQFMPCSGLNGTNLKYPVDKDVCPWYDGPAFIPYIDKLPSISRNRDGPFMMPVVDRYNDRGTIIMGKVESGCCQKGDSLLLMPNKTSVSADTLWRDDDEVNSVHCGENVKVKLRGVEEGDIIPGFVLTDPNNPCKTGRIFDAKVVILEHKSIICAGYSAVCHMHSVAEEVTVKALLCLVDRRTNEKSKTRPRFVKQDQGAIMRFEASGTICMEAFNDYPQLGRFTLRDEGRTIAIGKVLKVIE